MSVWDTRNINIGRIIMIPNEAKEKALVLVNKENLVFSVATLAADGKPEIKGMANPQLAILCNNEPVA